MPFRWQQYTERCATCEQAAPLACPHCRVPLCDAHSCAPYGCCAPCATDMYFAVSRAGKRHIVGGSALAFVSTVGLYGLYALRVFPVIAAGCLVVGLAAGFGVMMWGNAISPRLTERALRRKFRRAAPEPVALLPAATAPATLSAE